MRNSKKSNKNPKSSRSHFGLLGEASSTDSQGENSSLMETTPAIAVVAPRIQETRNPGNPVILNSSPSCKAHNFPRNLHGVTTSATTSTNLSHNQNTSLWPVVEPVFHFGTGFEVHKSYCPTHSRSYNDHIVMFYLSPGVAASFQTSAGHHKILQGPVTVPMVSQNVSPPIPMPVQVPPGHLMQQIVDENGTLRHVILSTHHQQIQNSVQGIQHQIHGHYVTANGSAPHYYNTNLTVHPPTNHNHQPSSNNQLYPAMSHQQGQGSHSPSPPNLSIIGGNNNYQNNERAQRQYNKLLRKLETRNTSSSNANGSNNQHLMQKTENLSSLTVSRNTSKRITGESSTYTSDDGEESSMIQDEDDLQDIVNFLSSLESPLVKEITSHTALISWEEPKTDSLLSPRLRVIKYEILLGDNGKDGKYKSIFRGTNLSCRIRDLKAGHEYYVCLVAHMNNIQGETSDPVQFRTPAREPDNPNPPKLLMKTKTSLQLRWNAPCDNGASINYVLQMSVDDNCQEFTELCKIKGKQFTVTKLSPATWYHFRLAAFNDFGRSSFSETVSYITEGYPPQQPLPPKVQNISTSTITLLWNRRHEDGEFVLQISSQDSGGYMNIYYGPDLIYDCTQLQRATVYYFRLASKTDFGQSPWSEEISVSTLPESPSKPSKPTVKGKIHAYSFKVRWDPPLDRGGAEIQLYHLEISSGAIFERVYSGIQTEATCDRLHPGTTYQIRVICEGQGGVSPASDTCTITTEAVVPNPPQTPYYSNLPGPYAAVLQWERPAFLGGAPVIEYELEIEGILNDNSEKSKQKLLAYRGKDSYCVVKDLLPGESYTTQVRAVNRIGAGVWSQKFIFSAGSAAPSKPSPPEVRVISSTELYLKWNEPHSNGSPITDYKLECSTKQEDDTFTTVYEGLENFAELKNLNPFTLYYLRLQAVNASGRSPYSPMVCQKTPADVPSVPVFLHDLFVCTSNSINVYWAEPESNGEAITKYIIECGDRILETCQNHISIENLTSEQTYKVKVQAVNRIGASTFSQTTKLSTKPLPPKPPRLECIQFGHNFLKLKWGSEQAKVANSTNFQRFEVDMKIKSSTKDFVNVYTGTRNSIKVQKLHESTLYVFRICASTEYAGTGTWSDEYVFKTQAAQPNSVKILKCLENISNYTEDDESFPIVTIEWQSSKNNHFTDPIEYILQRAIGASSGNNKIFSFEEIYRGPEIRHSLENVKHDTSYIFKVVPVRMIKSKLITSMSSSFHSYENRRNEIYNSSDESDASDNDDMPADDTPVAYEYVYGSPSPVFFYKLSKLGDKNGPGLNLVEKKQLKLPSKTSTFSSLGKRVPPHQTMHKLDKEIQSDLNTEEFPSNSNKIFPRVFDSIFEFFQNRKNWSVTEESIIIWLGFMFFSIVVGCFLHFLMT